MKALGFDVKKREILSIVKDYDVDGTGKISFSDYIDIMTQKYQDKRPEDDAIRAFNLFVGDDQSGKISVK